MKKLVLALALLVCFAVPSFADGENFCGIMPATYTGDPDPCTEPPPEDDPGANYRSSSSSNMDFFTFLASVWK